VKLKIFNIIYVAGNPSLPGTVVCGVCGAVRFYRFVKQARKFGIFSCESCRKFISKMMKRQSCSKGGNLPVLECHKGAGEEKFVCVRFEVFMVLKIQVRVFQVVMPCSVVVGHQRFGRPCCLCLSHLTLKMEAAWLSETLFLATTLHGNTTQNTLT